MTPETAEQIYDILTEECGAMEYWRANFVNAASQPVRGGSGTDLEYRFQGVLGFGGKIYLDTRSRHPRVWVGQYIEDETPETKAMIKRVNTRLAALIEEE